MHSLENYIKFWDEMANDLDEQVGNDGSQFQHKLIRPATLRLLNPISGERILDIACGNGAFTRYLASLGLKVVAFDYSPKMIEHAQKRCTDYINNISFSVTDATKYNDVIAIGQNTPFDKAVANMAIMGIPEIKPIFQAVYDMLKIDGSFVFSISHPCFRTPKHEHTTDGLGLVTFDYKNTQYHLEPIPVYNNKCALIWHRPLQSLLEICFKIGFVLDGLEEPICTPDGIYTHTVWKKLPLIIVMRLRKK